MKTKICDYTKWSIRKKTRPTVRHVITAKMRCGHCGELFTPEDDFHNCPTCNHDHCRLCGGNWSASDHNECQAAFRKSVTMNDRTGWNYGRSPGQV